METTFGQRLRVARLRAGFRSQEALGDYIGVSGRTIRNYELGKTQPDPVTLEKLTGALGDIGHSDPVEAAVRSSRLVEWRQDAVVSEYKKNLYEQDREEAV